MRFVEAWHAMPLPLFCMKEFHCGIFVFLDGDSDAPPGHLYKFRPGDNQNLP